MPSLEMCVSLVKHALTVGVGGGSLGVSSHVLRHGLRHTMSPVEQFLVSVMKCVERDARRIPGLATLRTTHAKT